MADEARAMLDALMGADRNAPVEGASGISSRYSNDHNTGVGGSNRRQKRSCYDPDICPLYCAWSLSSQENPTWAETVAANEGAGGIDVYDLFTNTKSDIGPNPYRVDEHAREEFASLPDHEKRRLGFEDMLARKLAVLVRQCDRTVARNKEKLRQEVARAMKQRTAGSGKGNREDLIVTVNEQMLENCAKNVADAQLIEEEMASLVEELEKFEEEEQDLTKLVGKVKGSSEANQAKEQDKSKEIVSSEKKEKTKDKEKSKDKSGKDSSSKKNGAKSKKDSTASQSAASSSTHHPRLIELQKLKLGLLLQLQTLSLQLPPLRDNTDNLLRQLQYLRSDTSTDKIVCEVSGNFMSSRDADERIAAHYAGKQYVGWKLVREKLKELQKKGFGLGDGGGGDGRGGVNMGGMGAGMGGPPPVGHMNHGGSRGGGGVGYRGGGGGGGYGAPPPSQGWGSNYGGGGGDWRGSGRGDQYSSRGSWERDRGGDRDRRRRSRSRDRDRGSDDRWERDRYAGGPGRHYDGRGYDRRDRGGKHDRHRRR